MKQWLMGIFAASMLLALTQAVLPKGAGKRAAAFAGGLVMILAALGPVAKITAEDISTAVTKYRFQAEKLRTGVEVSNSDVMELIIQEQTAAYILDKGETLGLELAVEVVTERASDGWPYPVAVKITGEAGPEQRKKLGSYIENELAIGPEGQEWS